MRNNTRGDLTPQAYKIYRCLMEGQLINRKNAINEMSVQNLTARISEFRDKGVRFQVSYYYYEHATGEEKREAIYYMKMSDRNYNKRFVAPI